MSRLIEINSCFLKILRRSDRNDPKQLVDTFTDTGLLFHKLSTTDHQIIYGRRGTGKTHAIRYVSEKIKSKDDISILIDMRNVGSDGGIYSDESVSLSERGTRLLVETLKTIHDGIREFIHNDIEKNNLGTTGPILNQLLESITQTKVVGTKKIEHKNKQKQSSTDSTEIKIKPFQPALFEIAMADQSSSDDESENSYGIEGIEKPHIKFGNITRIIESIIKELNNKRIWIFLDEWSDIPIDIQPFLADLIKRTLLPIRHVTIKIAAIEQRSSFLERFDNNYIGMEVGSDISADINLDDFMVFGNDEQKSVDFFKNLFFKHLKSIMKEEGKSIYCPLTSDEMVSLCFTTKDTFLELIRASEGVPRDAINILFNSVETSVDDKVTMSIIRSAAKRWYESDKFGAVTSNGNAVLLLNWIIDEVIGKKRARAFLFSTASICKEIDYLFDRRILHVLKRNISAQDVPGVRYIVYGIDYGCYIDLISTGRAPIGLLLSDETNIAAPVYFDVPKEDMRSIRRSILDLKEFEKYIKSNN